MRYPLPVSLRLRLYLLRRLALALLNSLALVVFDVLLTWAGTARLAAHLERWSHNSRYVGRFDFESVRCVHSSLS